MSRSVAYGLDFNAKHAKSAKDAKTALLEGWGPRSANAARSAA
jgi:hypothetical protein